MACWTVKRCCLGSPVRSGRPCSGDLRTVRNVSVTALCPVFARLALDLATGPSVTSQDTRHARYSVELARLEAHLRTAWHDDLRLQSSRLASELSLATTQIMIGIGVTATVMVMFMLLLLIPGRATPRAPRVSAVNAVGSVSAPAPPVSESQSERRGASPEYSRSAVAAPEVTHGRSAERRLIPWMLLFWGTGIVTLVGATLAIRKL